MKSAHCMEKVTYGCSVATREVRGNSPSGSSVQSAAETVKPKVNERHVSPDDEMIGRQALSELQKCLFVAT